MSYWSDDETEDDRRWFDMLFDEADAAAKGDNETVRKIAIKRKELEKRIYGKELDIDFIDENNNSINNYGDNDCKTDKDIEDERTMAEELSEDDYEESRKSCDDLNTEEDWDEYMAEKRMMEEYYNEEPVLSEEEQMAQDYENEIEMNKILALEAEAEFQQYIQEQKKLKLDKGEAK